MYELHHSASWRADSPSSSSEIDDIFDQAVGYLSKKRKMQTPPQSVSRESAPDTRQMYEIKGSLYTEQFPIRLEYSILAMDDNDALCTTRMRAEYYHNLEGYGISLFVFNKANKQIGNVHIPRKYSEKHK